jgi:hypothetical protein
MVYIPGQSFNPYGVPPFMAENTPLPETVLFPTTAPTAPPIMGMRAPQVMPEQKVPAPAPVSTPTPVPAPTPTPTPTPTPALENYDLGNFDPQALLNITSQLLQPKLEYDPANVVYFDTGTKVGVPDPATGKMVKRNSAPVVFQPGETYTMRDRQGNVIATATTLEELQAMSKMSEEVPGYVLDKPEYVGMYKTGTTEKVPDDLGFFGTALDVGLPVLGAIAAGPLAPLGAAAGSGLASAAQGRSLKNTLLRAGLTAAGTAAGGALAESGPINLLEGTPYTNAAMRAAGSTVGSTAGGTASGALPAVGNVIIVPGTVPAATSAATGSALGSAAGTGLGSVATNVVSPQPTQPAQPTGEPSIEVVGKRIPSPSIFEKAVEPFASGVANALGPDVIPPTEGKPIIVEEKRPPTDEGALSEDYGAPVGATAGASVPPTEGNPIIVKGPLLEPMPGAEELTDAATVGSMVAGALPTGGILKSGQTPTDGTTTMETDNGLLSGIDLSKLGLSDWLNIAGLATGTLGNLFGGGGGGGGLSTVPAGLFSSIGGGGGGGAFSSTLPAANMPGLTAAPGTAYTRPDLSDVDWATYGERPEVAMFSYVPRPGEGPLPSAADAQNSIQPSAPPIMNEDEGAMARGGLVGYAAGGGVNGPGDGREDVIPAMLSDGEYVIDAETVALLGNGSSKAGADALDRFRVNLRKHKGKQLARGGFSNNAKSPMHYLNGAAG